MHRKRKRHNNEVVPLFELFKYFAKYLNSDVSTIIIFFIRFLRATPNSDTRIPMRQ